jgi:hypothetical protein
MTAKQFSARARRPRSHAKAAAELLGLGDRTVTGYAGGRSIPAPVAILMLGGAVTPDQVDAVR